MEYSVKTLISREKVEERIKELAIELKADYSNVEEEVIFIGLLKGSVIFLSDLVKRIDLPILIDFMSVSSYGANGENSTGIVKILKDTDYDVKGKRILIVEDIIDTGYTLQYVKQFLNSKGAKEIKVCSLLDKPERRLVEMKGEYIGFEIPNKFVVGYGLDYKEKHRNLPFIGYIEFE